MSGRKVRSVATTLCPLSDLDDGQARGFTVGQGRTQRRIFLVRRGDQVYAYRDACPHMGVPLPWSADAYLTRDGRYVRCASHGALFRVETGECVAGPCKGEALTAEKISVTDGIVTIVT